MRVVEEVRRDALGGMDRLLKGEADDAQPSAVLPPSTIAVNG